MIETRHCSGCGAEIPPDAPLGQCPQCLIKLGLALATASPKPAGDRFGDYELVRQLGRGGMGVVYEAVQLSLHRLVALKMILDSKLASPDAVRRFKIEAEAAAKLDHPNIVPIHEVGEHEHYRFLSMKLIQGRSLRDLIARGELGALPKDGGRTKAIVFHREKILAQLLATIARAVYHAHQNGVLHRDLKPGNILIDQDGQPHLTDFGLAKILDTPPGDTSGADGTGPGATLGTPSYMSPEQAAGQRMTAASDIYGLGAMLYELLTGQPPFKAGTPLETMRAVLEQEPKRPRSVCPLIDRDLETICLKCLEKKPDHRYHSAEALAEDLERWQRREPIEARPAGIGLRLGRWTKRNPLGTALIGSIFAGLVIALVFLAMAMDRQSLLNQHLAGIIDGIVREVEEMWSNPELTHIRIDSQRLAALSGRRPGEVRPDTLHLTFALTINEAPVAKAQAYGTFFGRLEQKMSEALKRPVLLDLKLYRQSDARPDAMVTGEADYTRMNMLAFVRSRQSAPGLQLIARERAHKEAVIFANAASGITNLHQMIGKRVAFAHTNSIISFLAKVRLVRTGVSPANLGSWESLDLDPTPPRSVDVLETAPAPTAESEDDPEMYAHKAVIEQVRDRQFDAGEALRRHFSKNQYKGRRRILVEIDSFPVPPDVYVARAGLDTNVIHVLRQSLLSLKSRSEQEVLAKLHKTRIEGFDPVSDRDFDELRAALTNEARQFEAPTPRRAAAVPRSPSGE